MSTTSTGIVLDGDLRADGTIALDARPALPPGRVRVTVQTLARSLRSAARLPDPPWLDDCISAPFDLPHFGETRLVQPRPGEPRLPEPLEEFREESR
jgi:hypothetical protein